VGISKTAFGVALQRLAHLKFDQPPFIVNDYICDAILATNLKTRLEANRNEYLSPLSLGVRANVVSRSRFSEDLIKSKIQRGINNVVILGAGLDTCSLRLHDKFPKVSFFEVDTLETQTTKIALIKQASIPVGSNVTFVSADFETASLDEVLATNGLNRSARALFTWLGVTMYLTKDAIMSTLTSCSKFAKGSMMLLTYANSAAIQHPIEKVAGLLGEVWKTKLADGEVIDLLRQAGYSKCEIVRGDEIRRLFFEGRTDNLKAPRYNFMALGTV